MLRRVLVPIAPPLCFSCGALAPAEPLCAACRSALRYLAAEPVPLPGLGAWAPLAYDGPARALVGALKFRGAERVAEAMAAPIALGAPPGVLPAGAALVPVPLHPSRLRRRGFNQAELLASALGRRRGLAIQDILVRSGARGTQMGRPRAERLHALEGSIHARRRAPEACVLVDDVITTGATLVACAVALRGAGARRVGALAFARTPGR